MASTRPPAPAAVAVRVSDDGQRLYCGGAAGFSIHRLRPLHTLMYVPTPGSIGVTVGLGSTSLVATTGGARGGAFSSRCIVLYNIATEPATPAVELRFDSPVLNVCVSVHRMVAVTRNRIHIYDLASAAHLVSLDTADNPTGLAVMSQDLSAPYLVFPKPDSKGGELLVYDTLSLTVKSLIEAHRTPVTCMCVSPCGTRVATASMKGTMIRVFALPSGTPVQIFRRGTSQARVCAMAFFSVPLRPDAGLSDARSLGTDAEAPGPWGSSGGSISGEDMGIVSAGGAPVCLMPSFLVVGSSMPTVHVFRLKDGPRVPPFLMLPRAERGSGRARVDTSDSHHAPPPAVACVPVPSRYGDKAATASAAAPAPAAAPQSFASAMASAAEAAISAAIGLEGDRDFATAKLASVQEATAARTVDASADPYAAADPPVAVCITPAWFHVVASSAGSKRSTRSEPEVSHTRTGSAVYSVEAGSEDEDAGFDSRSRSEEEEDPEYEVVGHSLVPGQATHATDRPRTSTTPTRTAAEVIRTAIAHRTVPPPYVLNVVTQGARVLQFAFDPEAGGPCPSLGDNELPEQMFVDAGAFHVV